MAQLLRKYFNIALLIAIILVIGVAFLALSGSNKAASGSSSSIEGQELTALQVPAVPSAVQTGVSALNPLTPAPVYSPLPTTPEPPPLPFPTNPMPTWTAVPIGSDDAGFLTPIIPAYTPQPTPRPDEPYHLRSNAFQEPVSTEELTMSSSLIAIGTVKQVGPARWTTSDGKRPQNPHAVDNRDYIFTPVLVTIDTYVKGKPLQAEILLKAIGGTVGRDIVETNQIDLSTFREGERVVLFLGETELVDRVQMVDRRPLWRVRERYTVKGDGTAMNSHVSLPLQQLISEINKASGK